MSPAHSLIIAAGLVMAAPVAWAQVPQMRLSEILGREVTTSAGERMAIRDLVIDPVSGKVEYIALGRPGSAPEELQLFPIGALRSSVGSDSLLVVGPEDSASAGASAAPRAGAKPPLLSPAR